MLLFFSFGPETASSISVAGRLRRLGAALLCCCLLTGPALCLAADEETGSQSYFGFEDVEQLARSLAEKPFAEPAGVSDEKLLRLSAEEWAAIRYRPESALWRDEHLPFTVELYPPGFIYNQPVGIQVIDKGRSTRLTVPRTSFTVGDGETVPDVLPEEVEAAGFRILYPLLSPDHPMELASFLGATFFRGLGRHARNGLYARGLALDTALPDGEEFPRFTDFWLVKPEPDADSLTVYALMDSPSMTGAFSLVIRPGTSTIMDVDCVLFPRKNARGARKVGLAPLTSMFFFSETMKGRPDDYRPEVHNSDGLLYSPARDKWFWKPLVNPERLSVTVIPMTNPRGFGLLQRDNVFDHYQDIGARFDLRSSLWVEPQGDWGPGRLELIEIPTRDDIHDNIALFWVPEESADAPKAEEAGQTPGQRYAYRLFWMAPGVSPHALGRVEATRLVRSPEERDKLRFIVDFDSESLKALPWDTGLTSVVELPEGAQLLDKHLEKNPVTGGWRLSFSARLPKPEGVMQNLIPARDPKALRFRALLKRGENLPDFITEVWQYDVTP